jgi:iron complex outermembrane receptor protein
VYRNLGRVNKWGIDGSVAYEPVQALTLYAFGSWNKSRIKENILTSEQFGITDCDAVSDQTTTAAIRSCSFTAGKYEAGAPKWSYGFSAVGRVANLELGATAKKTGPRYIFDNNRALYSGDINGANQVEIFPAAAPSYWLVNLDARFKLTMLKGLEKSYFQLNVYNLFDKMYVGGFTAGSNQSLSTRCGISVSGSCPAANVIPTYGAPPFAQIGVPRTISGTLSLAF